MTHEDVQASASEYLLGSLDEVTAARVASHLAGCDACRDEVREVARTLDALARSVPEVHPPAALRDRIVAIPSTVPQVAAVAPSVAIARPRPPRIAPWFAAVAAALVAAVAMWQAASARAEVDRLRQELADVRSMAGQTLVANASLQQQVDDFTRQTNVLRASDLVSYSLARQPGAPEGVVRARAYVTQQRGLVFTAEGLPTLPAGKVYQLWVIVDAKAVSAGLLSPDSAGRVYALLTTPDIAAMPGAVAVTIEPAGGLSQPSTPPILVGIAQQ